MDPYAPSRVGRVCRYFLNGNCKFGLRCRFLHESSVLPSIQICQYFQKGTCWYGVHCRYLHVVQNEGAAAASTAVGRRSSVPSVSSPSVVHAVTDRRGSEPALLQAQATSTSTRQCSRRVQVTIPNPQQSTEHLAVHTAEEQSQDSLDFSSAASQESVQRSEVTQTETNDGRTAQESASIDSIEKLGAAAAVASSPGKMEEKQAFLQSKDITCGICMDKVFEKPNERDHVFGILPNCNHSFCLQCIITWRKTKDFGQDVVKSCPQCRVKSTFYVPNSYWVEGEEKEKLIVAFRERCRRKKCDYYMQYGCCPFKKECLYRHDPTSRCRLFAYPEDDDDGIDLLDLVIAIFGNDDDDDNDDDSDFPFYLFRDCEL